MLIQATSLINFWDAQLRFYFEFGLLSRYFVPAPWRNEVGRRFWWCGAQTWLREDYNSLSISRDVV